MLTVSSRAVHAETPSAQQPFLYNLRLGSTGNDVQRLQEYLNNHSAPVASSGLGSSGKETQYFGPATARAVSRFQELHADVILSPLHLTKGTGNFYTTTRNFVNKTLEQVLIPLTSNNGLNPRILSGPVIDKWARRYTIGGSISGLTGTVVLTAGNGDSLTISRNGTFVFPNTISSGRSYSVNITSQPVGQTCVISNGSGTMGGSNVTNISVSCSVALVSITVTPSNARLPIGINQQFTAIGHYADSSTADITAFVTWDTSDHNAATVDGTGLATGVAPGVGQISAFLNGILGTTNLTVTDAVLVSIAISPSNPAVARDSTLQLSALGTFSDGSTVDITNQATWTSTNTNVAMVTNIDPRGQVTGVSGGSSSIHATINSIVGAVTLFAGN